MALQPQQDAIAIPRAGDPISAREYGKLVRAATSGSLGSRVFITAHGVYARQATIGEIIAAVETKIMIIKQINDDYLQCREWDGQTEGDEFNVARPWLLRRSPFDGSSRAGFSYSYTTNQRRVSDAPNLDPETQVITPAYVLGDNITAIRSETLVNDVFNQDVDWLEISPIRVWASVLPD